VAGAVLLGTDCHDEAMLHAENWALISAEDQSASALRTGHTQWFSRARTLDRAARLPHELHTPGWLRWLWSLPQSP
jgi:hypothetical protein